MIFLLVVIATTGFLVAALWFAIQEVGRTPGEIIQYLERRLQGHPKLEFVAIPVLHGVRDWLGEPDSADKLIPFPVPILLPNPALPPSAASPEPDRGSVIRVGPRRKITRIGVAARLAKDGDTVEIDAGDYVADTAVWSGNDLTIRGLGDRVRLLAAGAHAEGKGIWVVRGGRVTVHGIEFVGARVPDGNGAGIRLERGHLTVRNCVFLDSQSGILTSGHPETSLIIEGSEFGYLGTGSGQTHAIYVGAIASFRLTGSYVHHVNVGHLVKSRAQVNRIEYNRLTDEIGGRASYELEFPNGGLTEVVGNIIQQGRDTRNSVIVSYGVEGYRWSRQELHFSHNTVVNAHPHGGTFIRVREGAELLALRNNLYVGRGKLDILGATDSQGDRFADWSDFVRAGREDFRPTKAARDAWGRSPLAATTQAMTPTAEYVHPRTWRALKPPVMLPGALQNTAQ